MRAMSRSRSRRLPRLLRRLPLIVAAVGAAQLLAAASVLATDDYTLPFYDRDVSLLYGVDRDPRVGIQLDYTGKTWFDASTHPGRGYDNHTGLDYPMPLRSPVAASREGVVTDTEGGYGTQQFGSFGNFVLVHTTALAQRSTTTSPAEPMAASMSPSTRTLF